LPINIAAVAYGLLMIVNIAWPRAEIYDLAETGSWWALLFPMEFVAAAALIGWFCWRRTSPVPVPQIATA
jgi:hypothetical protein